ncbi:MAG: hypothetical protein ACHREM_15965 [Polyangiales bacterium]
MTDPILTTFATAPTDEAVELITSMIDEYGDQTGNDAYALSRIVKTGRAAMHLAKRGLATANLGIGVVAMTPDACVAWLAALLGAWTKIETGITHMTDREVVALVNAFGDACAPIQRALGLTDDGYLEHADDEDGEPPLPAVVIGATLVAAVIEATRSALEAARTYDDDERDADRSETESP